jgi:hypothetical protein
MGILVPTAGLAARSAQASQHEVTARNYPVISKNHMNSLVGMTGISDPGTKKFFEEVVQNLWQYFQAGAKWQADKNNESSYMPNGAAELEALLVGAYDTVNLGGEKSGDLIVTKLAKWNQLEENTNVCSFMCGSNAVEAARKQKKPKLDKNFYADGYKKTETEMMTVLARARAGKEYDADLLGGGC